MRSYLSCIELSSVESRELATACSRLTLTQGEEDEEDEEGEEEEDVDDHDE